MDLGKVPYVHVSSDLDYVFDFASQKHRVKQANHKQTNFQDTLNYGKTHAAKVFYLHHMKRNRLPQIKVMKYTDYVYGYSFQVVDSNIIGGVVNVSGNVNVDPSLITYDEYTQALDKSIIQLLKYFGIEGL